MRERQERKTRRTKPTHILYSVFAAALFALVLLVAWLLGGGLGVVVLHAVQSRTEQLSDCSDT